MPFLQKSSHRESSLLPEYSPRKSLFSDLIRAGPGILQFTFQHWRRLTKQIASGSGPDWSASTPRQSAHRNPLLFHQQNFPSSQARFLPKTNIPFGPKYLGRSTELPTFQSKWKISSISAHHSPSFRVRKGSWSDSIMVHHSRVFSWDAIRSRSASRLLPWHS